MRRLLPFLLVATLVPGLPARGLAEDRTPNLTVEAKVPYAGGTELATDGRYVYAGQWNGRFGRGERPKQGGVRIFDTQVDPPKVVGTVNCPGTDIDVAVPRPGLLAIAHHASSCGVRGNGVTLFDVSNPAKPRKLSSIDVWSAHTLTAVPGTTYLYVSPGGLGNGLGFTTIVDVKDARRPRVVGELRPDQFGCHDVTFQQTLTGRTLGVCAGYAGVRLWDLADPLRPRTLSVIKAVDANTKDVIQFAHGAAISPDGMLLVVNDEAFMQHRCDGAGDADFGSLHLYDIADPARPSFLGRIVPPRGRVKSVTMRDGVSLWCTSHQLNFAPLSRRLVNAWFSGGVSVWDLTIPTQPREEAHYVGNGAVAWTAHWLNDRIWVNDLARGVEVLRLSLLPTGGPVAAGAAGAVVGAAGAALGAGTSPAWRPASSITGPLVPRPARPPRGPFVCKTPAY